MPTGYGGYLVTTENDSLGPKVLVSVAESWHSASMAKRWPVCDSERTFGADTVKDCFGRLCRSRDYVELLNHPVSEACSRGACGQLGTTYAQHNFRGSATTSRCNLSLKMSIRVSNKPIWRWKRMVNAPMSDLAASGRTVDYVDRHRGAFPAKQGI